MSKDLAILDLKKKLTEMKNRKNHVVDEQVRNFFENQMNQLEKALEITERGSDYYFGTSLDVLKEENQSIYHSLLKENYASSFENPVYTVKQFGKDLGQILAFIAAQTKQALIKSFKKDLTFIQLHLSRLEVFLKAYLENPSDLLAVKKELIHVIDQQMHEQYTYQVSSNYDVEHQYDHHWLSTCDLSDLRYLYAYGSYVTSFEHQMASFMQSYPQSEVEKLAKAIASAYVEGFKRDNKDMSKRKNVRIIANVGQELLTRSILKHLESFDLKPYVNALESTAYNPQFDFDHKFDRGLYLSEELNEKAIAIYKQVTEEQQEKLQNYSGVLFIERFGEEPFSPKNNDSRIKLDELQQKLFQKFQIEVSQMMEKHIPEKERSFCIVAFPSPEIGENFEAIFSDVAKINMLDSKMYEKIQQVIIDALDQGDYVHVKGYKGNETDIKVKLHALKNPAQETNFLNCVADVNIPVGEVFTSPQLKGTNGLLHVDTVYLDGFNYKDLKLNFEDGYVEAYSCANEEDEEKNKEFVRENLLFPHQTLPLGEFAIGTNTLAYVIGEKYGIVDKMPILIVEKMGPHFAIGDTCFSWSEDNPVYNPLDGKEIIARDNEKSILRKEDVSKAYTNCHTDITIPYDSLEHITVVKADGERIEIIREGRFVLKGTEELNDPFDGKY